MLSRKNEFAPLSMGVFIAHQGAGEEGRLDLEKVDEPDAESEQKEQEKQPSAPGGILHCRKRIP